MVYLFFHSSEESCTTQWDLFLNSNIIRIKFCLQAIHTFGIRKSEISILFQHMFSLVLMKSLKMPMSPQNMNIQICEKFTKCIYSLQKLKYVTTLKECNNFYDNIHFIFHSISMFSNVLLVYVALGIMYSRQHFLIDNVNDQFAYAFTPAIRLCKKLNAILGNKRSKQLEQKKYTVPITVAENKINLH